MLVGPDDIRLAQQRIAGVAVRTPLLSAPLGADGGPGLALKPENLQPVGAFKLRGAHNAIAALCERSRPAMVVTHSSGNHARGVAYAARTFGLPATIVMPETTPAVKVEATRALGATVELVHPSRRAARAAELVAEHGAALVPPYDDPLVIAGQGTVGAEIVADAPDVDLVIAPVSGGGLISGIAVAVKSVRPEAKVIGVEPELAADARDSLRAGERREWPLERVQRTIADALRVTAIGELPWEHIRAYVDDIVAVTDDELRSAVRLLALRARLVAEPGGAASLAAYLFHRDELPQGRRCVAVISGGNIDPALFAEIVAGRPN
jgi:threo-3-hydroxy-L-aspartate ammonia-lyase